MGRADEASVYDPVIPGRDQDMDMPERTLLNMPQVAQRLGHSRAWFYRNREMLEREHGFPGSVLGCGKRWDPTAIDCWLDRQMPAHLRPGPPHDEAGRYDENEPPEGWEQWVLDRAREPIPDSTRRRRRPSD